MTPPGSTKWYQVMSDVHERYSQLTRNIDLGKLLTSFSRLKLSVEQRLPEATEQFLSLPPELFNQLQVPVPSFDNPREHDINHIRCAVSFRQQCCQHDWAWIKEGDEMQFGALLGRLPGQVESLFKVQDQNFGYSHQLALGRMLRPGPDGGAVDPHYGLVKGTYARGKTGSDFAVINISSICGIAHILPVYPFKADECETWLVNSRIDLSTFNEIY